MCEDTCSYLHNDETIQLCTSQSGSRLLNDTCLSCLHLNHMIRVKRRESPGTEHRGCVRGCMVIPSRWLKLRVPQAPVSLPLGQCPGGRGGGHFRASPFLPCGPLDSKMAWEKGTFYRPQPEAQARESSSFRPKPGSNAFKSGLSPITGGSGRSQDERDPW